LLKKIRSTKNIVQDMEIEVRRMQFWNDLQAILDIYNSLHHFKPLCQPIRFYHLFPKSMKRDRFLRNRKNDEADQ
jgi:hypothetical protein